MSKCDILIAYVGNPVNTTQPTAKHDVDRHVCEMFQNDERQTRKTAKTGIRLAIRSNTTSTLSN